MGFALHPQAIDDLDSIHEYISQFNFSSANQVLEDIVAAFESLAQLPHQGHRRSDLTSRPLRFKIVRTYLIAYAPERDPVSILAVIDGRRSPRVIAATLQGRR